MRIEKKVRSEQILLKDLKHGEVGLFFDGCSEDPDEFLILKLILPGNNPYYYDLGRNTLYSTREDLEGLEPDRQKCKIVQTTLIYEE